MDKSEKKRLMEKMLRELEDILNSQTSLLKKIAQLEAENINLGNSVLEKRLPDIHGKVDDGINEIAVVMEEFALGGSGAAAPLHDESGQVVGVASEDVFDEMRTNL